mmetsp:Transcript_18428/g.51673  ORF Transcript_18428/g.51673 Transcript_18428/m.51673 type:complete len:636 (-) Transcript_18428:160-2067(-)
MATRTSIRPRPVDINKQLTIVRDIGELDTTEGLPKEQGEAHHAGHGHASETATHAGAADGHHAPHQKKPKPKEIPVPEVKKVPTYTREYLPTFKIPDTYIRGKGGVGYAQDDFVEYDLDTEDEKWLATYNRGSDLRLSDLKFERMLWRLELAWAEAIEGTLTPAEKCTPASLASTACLPKLQGVAMLKKTVGARSTILEAVYDYWAAKRKKWGKPLLRRLQAPTNPSDTNPYNVFRPREKVNRPLTRRRRENSVDCLEKLRTIHENILHAMEITELMVMRERKKRDIYQVDISVQQLQLCSHHQSREVYALKEQEVAAKLQDLQASKAQQDPRLFSYLDAASTGYTNAELDSPLRMALIHKRRRIEREARSRQAVTDPTTLSTLPPPPTTPDIEPLWVYQPDLAAVFGVHQAQQNGVVQAGAGVPYVTRGGRIAIARCDPLTRQSMGEEAAQHQGTPNGAVCGVQGPGTEAGSWGVLKPPLPRGNPHMMSHNTLFPWQRSGPAPWADTLDVSLLPDELKPSILASRAARAVTPEYLDILAASAASRGVPPFADLAAQASSTTAAAAPSTAQRGQPAAGAASRPSRLVQASATSAAAPAAAQPPVLPGNAMDTLRSLLHPKSKMHPKLVPSQVFKG